MNNEAIVDWYTVEGGCFFKQPIEHIPRSLSITIAKVCTKCMHLVNVKCATEVIC